ncbi:hypothetical protein CC80DRAFT_357199, partial [Byssothecium circinans]
LVSILLLYLRLLVLNCWSSLWTTIHTFIAISSCFYFALKSAKVFQFSPISRGWAHSGPGSCINMPLFLQTNGRFNTISDALILLVPVKSCCNLSRGWRSKVGICAVFTIGAVSSVSIMKRAVHQCSTARSQDSTYNDPKIALWSYVF